MNDTLKQVVKDLLRENPDARLTVHAICKRGMSRREAEAEIGRAFLACIWEQSKGMPNRWLAVLESMREGRTTAELFPDTPYTDEELLRGEPQKSREREPKK
jgi:hypothetical protein